MRTRTNFCLCFQYFTKVLFCHYFRW